MFLKRGKKGQSTAEYAILIGLIIAAAIGMQTYVKRGMQAKLRNQVATTLDIVMNAKNNTVLTESNFTQPLTKFKDSDVQFEIGNITAQNTRQVVSSSSDENMTEGGALTRNESETTRQGATDKRTYEY